jgi:multiple sugar transport system ATP-binding protein
MGRGEAEMSAIVLQDVSKVFPGGVQAVHSIDLTIASGEFMVLVGPSGCGKTTLLRMIAGLEEVSEGTISIGERDVTDLAPRDRDIAPVYQSYARYPHMSVARNLGYGLKVRKMEKTEIARRVAEVARMLGLETMLDRRPAALSGGQRQRVAMGRAIVRDPAVFLMDEPLSNLDAKLRIGMRAELSRLHERLGVTTVYVTHDQVEAMTLGQRVAVMRSGFLQQVETPQNLYHYPANLFVAAFIGAPSMNLVEAAIADGHVTFAGLRIPLRGADAPPSGTVVLGIRPQSLEDAVFADPQLPTIEVETTVVEDLGSEKHVIFAVDAPPVDVEEVREAASDEGGPALLLADDRRSLFTAVVAEASAIRPGERATLAVDPGRFQYFDPKSGQNLSRTALATV